MYTIVLVSTEQGLSGRVEDSSVACQNTTGNFETRERALAFMNAMPELAALAVDVAHNRRIGELRRTVRDSRF